jgi:ketosteroid isomerase-like protein
MEYSGQRSPFNRRRLSNSAFLIAIASCVLFVSEYSFSQTPDDMAAIRLLLDNQVAAWNRGDIEGYMRGYWESDSTLFNSGGSLTKGYRAVLMRYKKSYDTREKMGTLGFRDLVIRPLSSNAAVANGVWELNRKNDKPWGRFTLIVERKPEGWRVTHDHTSSADK